MQSADSGVGTDGRSSPEKSLMETHQRGLQFSRIACAFTCARREIMWRYVEDAQNVKMLH